MEQDPYCMPHELLLTFTSGGQTPHPDGETVTTLLERSRGVARTPLHPIPPAAADAAGGTVQPADATSSAAQPPLTLRLLVPPPAGGAPDRALLKDVADRINGSRDQLTHQGVALSSATPNWIVSGANGGGKPIGGPGTFPEPAPSGDWRFELPEAGRWPGRDAGASAGGEAPEQPVVVAVLDSSPGEQALREAAKRYPDNWLLQSLVDKQVIKDWTRFSPAPDVPAPRSDVTPDHGLFVAGVIHSVAPHAEIQLLHILDDQGAGHTDLLLRALDRCVAIARSGRRLVVNLSLFLMIPPDDEIWAYWFGDIKEFAAADLPRLTEMLDALDEAVEGRITLLLDAGAVVVAAAGNDAFFYHHHAQPRLPADYDTVLCVVAADRNGRIAAYSNRGDVPFSGNCVATYGGQGRLQGGVPVVPPGPEPRDGIAGIYTQRTMDSPLGTQENTTGWAYWSGTSFATPLISGIAANLLARHERVRRADPRRAHLTPREVMAAILAMAPVTPGTDLTLGAPYVPITQQR